MTAFQKGQSVVVVGITDIDERIMLTDPYDPRTWDWQNPPKSWIGQVGTVKEPFINDYYDICLTFDWMADGDVCPGYLGQACFKYADVMDYDEAVAKWLEAELLWMARHTETPELVHEQ